MDFFRHYYENKVDFRESIEEYLNNWGFCNLDNTKIQTTDFSKDTSASSYIEFKWQYEQSTTRTNYRTFCTSFGNDGVAIGINPWELDMPSSTPTIHELFFIPLKNKGFIVQRLTEITLKDASSSSVVKTNLTPAFYGYTSPISFIKESGYAVNIPPYTAMTFIGTFQDNNMNYFYFKAGGIGACTHVNQNTGAIVDHDTLTFGNCSCYIGATRHNKIPFIESPYVYAYAPNTTSGKGLVGTQTFVKSPRTFDVNQNVCTLIRAPHDSSYLDNVYIITTSPQENMDGKIFSFSGRNFICYGRNLAFELPAN